MKILGFEVLTAVVMKSFIFWDITACSLLKANLRCLGTYRFHLQGRRISQARNQREAGGKQSSTDYAALYPRRWNYLQSFFHHFKRHVGR
jgi:hypothetical protein